MQSLNAPLVDQSGKPDSLKKPIQYFQNLPGGGWTSGQTGQNGTTTMNNSAWVASDTYLKLAELQLAYMFSARNHGFIRNQLRADNLTLQVTGTNLFRIDGNYQGLDQEGYYTLVEPAAHQVRRHALSLGTAIHDLARPRLLATRIGTTP